MIASKEEGYLQMRAKVTQKKREENLFKDINNYTNIKPKNNQIFS